MPLSEFKISKAKPREKPHKLTDGYGLFCWSSQLAQNSGNKKWRYLDKERRLSHGQYPIVSLAKARKTLKRLSSEDKIRILLARFYGEDTTSSPDRPLRA